MSIKTMTAACGLLMSLIGANVAGSEAVSRALGPVAERAETLTISLRDTLELSEPQTEQVRKLNLDCLQRGREIKDGAGRRIMKIRQLAALRADRDRQLKSILSADQYRKFQARKSDLADDVLNGKME